MRRTLSLISVLLLPACTLAQKASPAPPTIQVTSRIVYVDVIVRDANGHIVRGLKQQDFKVEEDGKPQTIDYFDEHIYNPANPAQPSSRPVSNREFSNVNSSGESGVVTILLLDLLNTATDNQLVARTQMLKFLAELPPGRRISLFTLTNRLQMIQSFTGSPELLTAVAKMLKPVDSQRMPSQDEVDAEKARAVEFDKESHSGHDPMVPSAMDSNIQTQETDLSPRTYSTISALTQLARMMSGYQGRKNLFWVSESFPVALNTTQNFLGQTSPLHPRKPQPF